MKRRSLIYQGWNSGNTNFVKHNEYQDHLSLLYKVQRERERRYRIFRRDFEIRHKRFEGRWRMRSITWVV